MLTPQINDVQSLRWLILGSKLYLMMKHTISIKLKDTFHYVLSCRWWGYLIENLRRLSRNYHNSFISIKNKRWSRSPHDLCQYKFNININFFEREWRYTSQQLLRSLFPLVSYCHLYLYRNLFYRHTTGWTTSRYYTSA